MGKGTNRLEIIAQQNELLKEQNRLLREQNELLQRTSITPNTQEVFIENIDRDEMRSGFLVTSHRKKLWNVQIGLIKEFDRICKKYNLRWFAFSGTLIGAARHKGFIPWDDDVDIFMMRPDYEKFKRIAMQEVKSPYFLDAWFNYRLEREKNPDVPINENLQLVKRDQEENYPSWYYPFWPIIKLRDSRTTMIQWLDRPHVNQGVWIDIFAFDSAPPFTQKQQRMNWQLAREMMLAIAFPDQMREAIAEGKKFMFSYKSLNNFLGITHRKRALTFENFMAKNFFDSERVVDFRDYVVAQRGVTYETKDFADITYLPFEKIELPVPVGYENVLTARYGDWRKLIFTPNHAKEHSMDMTYKDYFKAFGKRSPVIEEDRIVGFEIETAN